MKSLLIVVLVLAVCSSPQILSAETYEASYTPWSGYWWPFTAGGLVTGDDYRGSPAPLEKYDRVVSGSYSGPASAFGRAYYYDPEAVAWAGMCFAWSAAAIMENEPDQDGNYNGVRFRVGDKKGILTALYHRTLYNRYSIYSPVDFHHLLEEFIRKQRIPIIINLGSPKEIWNYPVYRYETTSFQSDNVLHYTTRIWYADDGVHPDFAGTAALSSAYFYYFILDAQGSVVQSDWEGESIGNAPVYASEPLGLADYDDGLNVDQVRAIVRAVDDEYEPNDSFEQALPLTTGSYQLLALDEDYFQIAVGEGDRLEIEFDPEEAVSSLVVGFYDSRGQLVAHISPNVKFSFTAETAGSVFLKIPVSGQNEDPGYTLRVSQSLHYQSVFPWFPSGSWWKGLALFNPDRGAGRTVVSLISKDGTPQVSCTPGMAFAGQFSMMLEDCFKARVFDHGYLRLDADFAFQGLQAIGYSNQLLLGGNVVSSTRASHKLAFPHITETAIDGWETTIGLLNLCEWDEGVELTSYDQQGSPTGTENLVLAQGQVKEWETRYTAFLPSGAKSLTAETTSTTDCLVGYTVFINSASGSKGRAFIGFPLEQKTELVLPHAACGSDWWTGMALMNSGQSAAWIKIAAYDASGRQVGETDFILEPNQNRVQPVESLFNDKGLCQTLASLRITSTNGQPVVGFALYGQKYSPCIAGTPLSGGSASSLYLPHVASSTEWWTGIGLMHPGGEATVVTVSLADGDGQILESKNLTLAPNAHRAFTIREFFGRENEPTGRSVTISAESGLISGMYLIGTTDGATLMGDALAP